MTTMLNSTSYYDGHPMLVHHTMVAPILREFSDRTNRDQYRMFTWNGVQIEGAEDFNVGVQPNYPHTPPPRMDWEQMFEDGELAVSTHGDKDFLRTARMLFNCTPASRDWWCETPYADESGVLDMFTPDAVSFKALLLHLDEGDVLPHYFGVFKALRDMQVPLPHRGRRQRATATQKRCKRREGDDDARGGGKVHGHDARVGTMRGLTRVRRRRGAQPLTQCAPPSHSLRVQ